VRISIDRLKPAYILLEDEEAHYEPAAKEETTMKSGRTVKLPIRFQLK